MRPGLPREKAFGPPLRVWHGCPARWHGCCWRCVACMGPCLALHRALPWKRMCALWRPSAWALWPCACWCRQLCAWCGAAGRSAACGRERAACLPPGRLCWLCGHGACRPCAWASGCCVRASRRNTGFTMPGCRSGTRRCSLPGRHRRAGCTRLFCVGWPCWRQGLCAWRLPPKNGRCGAF